MRRPYLPSVFQHRQSRSPGIFSSETGMVTVETAITMPVVILVLMVILLAARFGISHFEACSQAHNMARQYAIELPHSSPSSSVPLETQVSHQDGMVVVTVHPRPLNLLGMTLPSPACTASIFDEDAPNSPSVIHKNRRN